MTITQMTYFLEVVKHRGFSKAAEALFVNQSTLSKSIQSLESEFQVELVDRNRKSFTLTNEGEVFFQYAQRICNYYKDQIDEMKQRLSSIERTLRVGIPPTAGTVYFYPMIQRFRQKYPSVSLRIEEVTSKTVVGMVEDNTLDLGVVLEPFHNDAYTIQKAYETEVMLVVPRDHRLAKAENDTVSFSELGNEKFLMISSSYMFRDIVTAICKEAGFTPDVVFESAQWDALLEMASGGHGLAFLPYPLLIKANLAGVRLLHLTDPAFPWILSLIHKKNKFVFDSMQNFIDMAIEMA